MSISAQNLIFLLSARGASIAKMASTQDKAFVCTQYVKTKFVTNIKWEIVADHFDYCLIFD
jgi:hypothetical protein